MTLRFFSQPRKKTFSTISATCGHLSAFHCILDWLRFPVKGERPDDRSDSSDALSINFGIDFGTAYTKICYRNLNIEQSGIVDFSTGTEHDWPFAMIPSEILLGAKGEIVAGEPRVLGRHKKYVKADAIKMRLADLDLHSSMEGFEFDPINGYGDAKGIEFLATIFLGNVLISSRNWLLENRPDLFEGRVVVWSASVGVPVRIFDSPAIYRFHRVLADAWLLASDRTEPIRRVEDARNFLDSMEEGGSRNLADAHAYPEIAAAVLAFVSSPSAKDGHYLYFDIGGGTLDSVSFKLLREHGRKRVDFYMGEIQPLGVEAIMSRHTDVDSKLLLRSMRTGSATGKIGTRLREESRAVMSQVARIVMGTKSKNPFEWTAGKVNPSWYTNYKSGKPRHGRALLPLFIGGGGGNFKFYSNSIFDTFLARGLENHGIPKFTPAIVPDASDLDMESVPKDHFHRFAIAYGLSVDFGEAPAFKLPRQIPEIKLPPMKKYKSSVIYEG
jgi:hypothetical protein